MPWTKEDELQLRDLIERKKAEVRAAEECVERYVSRSCMAIRSSEEPEVVRTLIEDATTVRKLLEPFDQEHPSYLFTGE